MKIIYKTGSILDATEKAIVHGVNAQGKMGSGVARVLFERYPNVRSIYLDMHHSHLMAGKPFLGSTHLCGNSPHLVINAVTQDKYGYDGKLYASYEAILRVFLEINNELAPQLGIEALALPKIGCGLAGGDWAIVSEIIENTADNYQPVVYTLPSAPC